MGDGSSIPLFLQICVVGDAGSGAVGSDADGALQIGPPQGGSFLVVAVPNIGMRVMEHIEPPAGSAGSCSCAPGRW